MDSTTSPRPSSWDACPSFRLSRHRPQAHARLRITLTSPASPRLTAALVGGDAAAPLSTRTQSRARTARWSCPRSSATNSPPARQEVPPRTGAGETAVRSSAAPKTTQSVVLTWATTPAARTRRNCQTRSSTSRSRAMPARTLTQFLLPPWSPQGTCIHTP